MKKNLYAVLVSALLMLSSQVSQAVVIPWTGASDFDSSSMTFGGITANSVNFFGGIAGLGGAIYHDHGTPTAISLDVLLNAVWTNIYSAPSPGNGTAGGWVTLSSLGTLNFAQGLVTGFRASANPIVGFAYHGWQGSQLNFSSVSVPEPGTLALLGIGLFGMGLSRRRKQSVRRT